jgi:hypothetical protein
MNQRAQRQLRSDLAWELLSTADFLEKVSICPDTGPLKAAANECKGSGGDHWAYSVSNLILRLDPSQNGFPAQLISLDCRLNMRVCGLCSILNCPEDPMTEVAIDVMLEGRTSATARRHVQAWHFDRHLSDVNSTEPILAHPRYHFHFGGRGMMTFVTETGPPCCDSVLLLEGPRIAHAPLDGVLVIDFLLSNFVGEKWRKLREDQMYKRVIAASQKRNWQPFVKALLTHWSPQANRIGWAASDIWPHLCQA